MQWQKVEAAVLLAQINEASKKSEEIEDEIRELESMLPEARLDLEATCKSLAEAEEKVRLLILCSSIVSETME